MSSSSSSGGGGIQTTKKTTQSKKTILSFLDANTTLMLILPHLTPKEAKPFTMSCKVLHEANKNCKSIFLDPQKFASNVIRDYKTLLASCEYINGQIGRLMLDNYPPQLLLPITINVGNYQEFITMKNTRSQYDEEAHTHYYYGSDEDIEILCDCECRIRFFQSKKKPRVVSPVFNYICYPSACE